MQPVVVSRDDVHFARVQIIRVQLVHFIQVPIVLDPLHFELCRDLFVTVFVDYFSWIGASKIFLIPIKKRGILGGTSLDSNCMLAANKLLGLLVELLV